MQALSKHSKSPSLDGTDEHSKRNKASDISLPDLPTTRFSNSMLA